MNGGDDITAAQLRRARDLLGWSEDELALRANVGAEIIRQYEAGHYPPTPEQRSALRGAVVAAGVELTSGADPGARLRPDDAPDKGIHPNELTTENDR